MVSCLQRNNCCEVAPGAVASNGESVWVAANIGRVRVHPLDGGVTVDYRRRVEVLGRQPVCDRYNDGAGAGGQFPADRIVGVQVAEPKSTAVVVDEDRLPLSA